MAAKIIIILVIPVLFFSYVGNDPMKTAKNSTRNIAIVNEDDGADYQEDMLYLGRNVAESLGKESQYEWSVVNRNTAESGLQKKQYDAVIYLPSTFTKSVLTFNEEEPVKANIKYKIQPSLNAENAERVQKELETAKNNINTRVSRIYWSYVSDSMEDIRGKFEDVLEKEIAFQDTMYNFYNPSSQSLTGEIDSQRRMLEGILASTGAANETSDRSVAQIEGTKTEMAGFLEAVNAFKEYQLNQLTVMSEVSQANAQLIQESINAYDSVIKEGINSISAKQFNEIPEFVDNTEEMYSTILTIQESLDENNGRIQELTETINSSNVSEQFERLQALQRDNLVAYKQKLRDTSLDLVQPQLISLRTGLQSPGGNAATGKAQAASVPEADSSDISLDNLKQSLAELNKTASEAEMTDPAMKEKLDGAIAGIENSVAALETEVKEQTVSQQQWKKAVEEAVQNTAETLDETTPGAEDVTAEQILAKERDILASPSLTAERKAQLQPLFESGLQNRDISSLLQYYYYLSMYAGELESFAIDDQAYMEELIGGNEDYEVIMDAFGKVKAETQLFYQLQDSMDESAQSMDLFEEDFYTLAQGISAFAAEFEDQFGETHDQIMIDLFNIEEQTASVAETLSGNYQAPQIEAAPVDNLNGEFILAAQDGSLAVLQGVSGIVDSIADQQQSITSYTEELQSKVSSVQSRADELNNKWSENVAATTNINNDVKGLLNNTIVDGQDNPFMYDYLSNPVYISGEDFIKQTVPAPPVLMLVIILISSVLIGYFLHHLSGVKMALHVPLFLLLALSAGLIISMYGMKIYPMNETQALKWSILIVLLVIACTSLIRLAFFVGPFIGSLLIIAMIFYFTTPLMDLILPNFSVDHPIADVLLSIQQGGNEGYGLTLIILGIMSVIFTVIPYANLMKPSGSSSEAAHEA